MRAVARALRLPNLCHHPRRRRAIAFEDRLRPSFETPPLAAIRMRRECAAAVSTAPTPHSVIPRRPPEAMSRRRRRALRRRKVICNCRARWRVTGIPEGAVSAEKLRRTGTPGRCRAMTPHTWNDPLTAAATQHARSPSPAQWQRGHVTVRSAMWERDAGNTPASGERGRRRTRQDQISRWPEGLL